MSRLLRVKAAEFMNEQIKQALMFGAIGCAATIMIYQLVYQFTLPRGENFSTLGVLGGILCGLVVGGIAGGVTYAVNRNQ